MEPSTAHVRFWLSRPVVKPTGERVIGEVLETLEGAEITTVSASPGPESAVGIVAEMSASGPGRYELTSVRLHYRINGGGEQVRDGISVLFTICVDDPAPADCSPSKEEA